MKLLKTLLVLASLVPVVACAENLFKNSDMNGSGGWKGDRKYETVDGNRALSLSAEKKKIVSFSQDVKSKGITDLVLKFRYKTSDYKGRGLELRGKRDDGSSTFRTSDLKADDKWHAYTWNFSHVRGSETILFSIELLEGEGKVLFDDITVEPKG
ncbi:hypothetical protein OPIT5_11515 [Opitutaceae bacterium TAV5]|nr:hypothetical protein OPIT5_11515 [Opitutaceae bacterium TAV5]